MSDAVEGTPSITFTEAAFVKLSEIIAAQNPANASLRLQITGRQAGKFQHILSIVKAGEQSSDDVAVDVVGLRVFVERRNLAYLNGVQIHYEDGPNESRLLFMNPNPLWLDQREFRIQEVLDGQINPAIAAHGGYVNLLAVEGPVAFVELGGGCQGCGMADVTLKQGIEVAIREAVPSIERVVDQTDHASGENPYFQPAKK